MVMCAVIGGRRAIEITQTDTDYNTLGSTSHTFTGVSIGTANASRDVIVAVGYDYATTPSLTVEINGVTAPLISGTRANAGIYYAELHRLTVTSGTTATITLTAGASIIPCIAVWSVLYTRPVEHDTATSTTNNPSLSIDTRARGAVLAFAFSAGTDLTGFTWTNVTEEFDVSISAGNRFSGGNAITSTVATRTISATVAVGAGGGVGNTAACAVSF